MHLSTILLPSLAVFSLALALPTAIQGESRRDVYAPNLHSRTENTNANTGYQRLPSNPPSNPPPSPGLGQVSKAPLLNEGQKGNFLKNNPTQSQQAAKAQDAQLQANLRAAGFF